jgi:hypothetical protein
MYSWHLSIAHLPTEGFAAELSKHLDTYFEREPPEPFVAEAIKRQAARAVKHAEAQLADLIADELQPAPPVLTFDQKAENAQAKKKDPKSAPVHEQRGLVATVAISGIVPSRKAGDHAHLSVAVSLG